MGNAEMRSCFSSFVDTRFTPEQMELFQNMLWDEESIKRDWHKFSNYTCGLDFSKFFPVSIMPANQQDQENVAQLLLSEVASRYSQGYSTSESKLAELKDASKYNSLYGY